LGVLGGIILHDFQFIFCQIIEILTSFFFQNTSNEIKEKQEISEVTEKEIDNARETYQEVSQQASSLFFCISDLGNIDPMYQYSLAYYIDLFT
jgi:dynein heavy chain